MKEENPGKDSAGKFIKGHKLSSISKKDLEILVEQYCIHRAKGLDKQSFKGCDYRSIVNNASILQTEKIRVAEAEGWALWETVAMNVALGIADILPDGRKVELSKSNTTMIIFMLKNKMKTQYGELSDKDPAGTSDKGKGALPASVPFTIIDPQTNQTLNLDIGESDE